MLHFQHQMSLINQQHKAQSKMGLFDKEEITAPSIEAAVAQAVAPAATSSVSECTRDTRGEADCAVKNCENCN